MAFDMKRDDLVIEHRCLTVFFHLREESRKPPAKQTVVAAQSSPEETMPQLTPIGILHRIHPDRDHACAPYGGSHHGSLTTICHGPLSLVEPVRPARLDDRDIGVGHVILYYWRIGIVCVHESFEIVFEADNAQAELVARHVVE
jgi:hypothetical protein